MYQDKAQGFKKRDWFAELKRTKHDNHGKIAFDYFVPTPDDTFGRKIKGGPERFIKQVLLQNKLYDEARSNTEKQSRAKQQNISQQNLLGSTIFETDQALNKGIGKTYEEVQKAQASAEKLNILRRADTLLDEISGRLGRRQAGYQENDGFVEYDYYSDRPASGRSTSIYNDRPASGRSSSSGLFRPIEPVEPEYVPDDDDDDRSQVVPARYGYSPVDFPHFPPERDQYDIQFRPPQLNTYSKFLASYPKYQTSEASQPNTISPVERSADIGGSSSALESASALIERLRSPPPQSPPKPASPVIEMSDELYDTIRKYRSPYMTIKMSDSTYEEQITDEQRKAKLYTEAREPYKSMSQEKRNQIVQEYVNMWMDKNPANAGEASAPEEEEEFGIPPPSRSIKMIRDAGYPIFEAKTKARDDEAVEPKLLMERVIAWAKKSPSFQNIRGIGYVFVSGDERIKMPSVTKDQIKFYEKLLELEQQGKIKLPE